jgi:hypothetical protein
MSDVQSGLPPSIALPPPAPGAPQSGMPMGAPQQPSFTTADLMNTYAGQLGQGPSAAPPGDPTAFLTARDGKTFKQVHAEVKAAQLQGGFAQSPTDPTMQALLAPDPVHAVVPLSNTSDVVQHGAAAGILAQHATGMPDGFQGAQAEYARVDTAFKQGLITDPKLKQLFGKFKENPASLSAGDASTLSQMVSAVASATDVIQDPHLKLRVGKVTSIDTTPGGPVVQVQFDPKAPLDPALVTSLSATDTTLPILKPSTQGLGVYVAPSGTVGVVAPPTPQVATKVRHLYPSLTDGDGNARWLPGAPRKVTDGEQLRRDLDTASDGHVGETFDATAIDKAGGHPASVAGTHIAVDVTGGYQLQRLAHMGTPTDLGSIQRTVQNGDTRTAASAHRVMITLDPADAANVGTHANEILDTKNGSNVAIYAHDDVPGFTRAREHLYTDGVTVYAHRTADPEHTASHGFDVYVKDATGLPKTSPEGAALRSATFTPSPDQTLANGTFGRVIPAGQGTFETHGKNILNSTHGGKPVVGFGVFNEGRAPDVVLAYDEDTATHLSQTADAYGKPVGNSVHVNVDQSLQPAAMVAEAMRLIGAPPTRIVPSGQPAMSG